MSRDPSASLMLMLGRALRRRCPRCGAGAFSSYYSLHEICPGCGFHFEREPGYWVGSLIINTAVAFGAFIVLFVGGIIVSWPEVPWGAIAVVTIGVMALLPLVFYPLSKTIWMALELSWHPLEEKEIAGASEATTGTNDSPGVYSLFAISSSMTSVAPPPIEAIRTSR